jgi:hypothetical protein
MENKGKEISIKQGKGRKERGRTQKKGKFGKRKKGM